MRNPDAIFISAYIPNPDGSKYVVEKPQEGKDPEHMPSREYDVLTDDTYEATLHMLTTDVTGAQRKVQRRLVDKEVSPNHIVYETRPIAETAINSARYGWHDA